MKRQKRPKPPARPAVQHELSDVLGAFSDAIAFVEVVIGSLEADDGRGGPELHVLEHGLAALRLAYTQLDRAIVQEE